MDIVYYHLIDLAYLIFYQIGLIAPFWILGILAGGIMTIYFSKQIISFLKRLSNLNSTHIAIFGGSVLGAISPITMHAMVPLVLLMHNMGMSQAVLVSFIVTSILINPNIVVYSLALGVDIAILRLFACILVGYLGGALVHIFMRKIHLFRFDTSLDVDKNNDKKHISLFSYMKKVIKKTAPYLMLGIFLTAIFEKFMPSGIFDRLFVNNSGLGVLFGATMGVPLYFCGGGTISLIRAWMKFGMSTGSVIAFVIAGPATKINNISAIANMVKKKYIMLYLLFIIAISIVLGLITDLFI